MADSDEHIETIVKKTVHETLLQLGLDADDPLELQADFGHLRKSRKSAEQLRGRSMWLVIATAIAGFLSAAWTGFQQLIGDGR